MEEERLKDEKEIQGKKSQKKFTRHSKAYQNFQLHENVTTKLFIILF